MSETLTVPTHTAADTFTAFAAVNEAAATERLTTANPGRFIRTIGKDCPAWQAEREFFHNALQAAAKTGGDVKVYPKEIDGIDKLCFLDTGHGMNVDDLRNNLMQLNNSGGGVDDSRFGLGARITGLVWSPLGVEYVTWNGVDTPVRGRLTWSVDGCDVCWAELAPGVYLQPVDIADLPAEIRKAGHGTEVVLLGKHAGHNTFDALDENDTSTRKGKAHILFVNTRYVTLPSNVRVHVAARRDQNGNREMRRNDVTGMRQPFIDLGAYHAVVEVDGATVEVYTLPAEVRKSGWRNGDNAVLGSFVGAVLADGERPEMLEIYDKFEAQQGYRKLQSFGLGPISSRTAVFVHPHGAGAMAQRTNLRVNSQELPWHQWEEQFRANMPAELAALVDAALGAAPKSTKATDAVIEQLTALATSVAHMNLAAFGQMTVLAERHAAGGCGGNNRVGARGQRQRQRRGTRPDRTRRQR